MNTESTVGLNASCVYAHVFSDKSVYVGASKFLGGRNSDFTPRNDTYATKLEKFGNPTINIIDTFDTSDGDYKIVFEREREVFMLLEDMGVETVNERRPTGAVNPYWTGDIQRKTSRKRVNDGTHNFLGGDINRETNRKRVENGTHHFLGGDLQRKRVNDGTHHHTDYAIYSFECFKGVDEGQTFTGMRKDFYVKYPYVTQSNMSAHVRGVGQPNGANGWRLKK